LLELIEFRFLVTNGLVITNQTVTHRINVCTLDGAKKRSQTDKWQGRYHENRSQYHSWIPADQSCSIDRTARGKSAIFLKKFGVKLTACHLTVVFSIACTTSLSCVNTLGEIQNPVVDRYWHGDLPVVFGQLISTVFVLEFR
jgi:hypothetical protein